MKPRKFQRQHAFYDGRTMCGVNTHATRVTATSYPISSLDVIRDNHPTIMGLDDRACKRCMRILYDRRGKLHSYVWDLK